MMRALSVPVFVALLATLLALVGQVVQGYDNGMANTPPMGWSTWSTNDLAGLRDHCNEWEIRRRVDGLHDSGMWDLGYRWIMVDDCWAAHQRDPETDQLQPDPLRFPSGIPALVEYAHSFDVKIGFYTSIGTQTCKKNRPGSYGHYELDAQTFADWNVDLVKCDNCDKPSNETDQDLFTTFSNALNATGHPMLFAMCQWGSDNVLDWGFDLGQMVRVQMDHLPLWHWPPFGAGAGYGAGVKDVIDYMGDLNPSLYQQPNSWMDPDFLETMFPLTEGYTESRTEFSFWAFWAAPMFMATDMIDMGQDKRSIVLNAEVIAINQDPLFNGGTRLYKDDDGRQIWFKPLANGDACVILYNSGSWNTLDIEVTWDMLDYGWTSSDTVYVRDLWLHADIGPFVRAYSANVDPRGVVMLRLYQK